MQAGLRRLLSNVNVYCRILGQFDEESRDAAKEVQQLAEGEKTREAEILAHSVKGTLSES